MAKRLTPDIHAQVEAHQAAVAAADEGGELVVDGDAGVRRHVRGGLALQRDFAEGVVDDVVRVAHQRAPVERHRLGALLDIRGAEVEGAGRRGVRRHEAVLGVSGQLLRGGVGAVDLWDGLQQRGLGIVHRGVGEGRVDLRRGVERLREVERKLQQAAREIEEVGVVGVDQVVVALVALLGFLVEPEDADPLQAAAGARVVPVLLGEVGLGVGLEPQIEGGGVDVGPAQRVDVAQDVLPRVGLRVLRLQQLHAVAELALELHAVRLVEARPVADAQPRTVRQDHLVDDGQHVEEAVLAQQIDRDHIVVLVADDLEVHRAPQLAVAGARQRRRHGVGRPQPGAVGHRDDVADVAVLLAAGDRQEHLHRVEVDDLVLPVAPGHVGARVGHEVVGRQVEAEEAVVQVLVGIDDVLGLGAAGGVEGAPGALGLLLRGQRREVRGTELAGHLEAEQARRVGAVAQQLAARQGQAHVAGLDRLDDLVLGALEGQADLGPLRTERLAVVVHLQLDLLADLAREVDLQLLLHVQGREQALAAAPLGRGETVAERRLAGDRDVLAARDADVGLLAAADDPLERARQLDRDRQVDQPGLRSGGAGAAAQVQVLPAGDPVAHGQAAFAGRDVVVDEQTHLGGVGVAGRVVDEAAGQVPGGLRQQEVLGVAEDGLEAQRAGGFGDRDPPLPVHARRAVGEVPQAAVEAREGVLPDGIEAERQHPLAHHEPVLAQQAGIVGGAQQGIEAPEDQVAGGGLSRRTQQPQRQDQDKRGPGPRRPPAPAQPPVAFPHQDQPAPPVGPPRAARPPRWNSGPGFPLPSEPVAKNRCPAGNQWLHCGFPERSGRR
ncbi:MAG: hypothetical protein IPI34_01540 [bacterium]|nr:hypothetical protein [bacterium]